MPINCLLISNSSITALQDVQRMDVQNIGPVLRMKNGHTIDMNQI